MKSNSPFLLILVILFGFTFAFRRPLYNLYRTYLVKEQKQVTLTESNEYKRDYNFNYVKRTDDFTPSNYQDLLNIYYTVLNSGEEEFSFYCTDEYSECINDVDSLANNQKVLSTINNFVHPFNGFNHIETQYDSLGKVSIHIEKSYSKKQIQQIEEKVNELANQLIVSGDSDINNIRRIHDYIINHTIYDSDRSDYNITTYDSDIAYGPLFQGYGICGGYTDAMELFLEEMGIKSYKISSEQHVWNAVYIDGKWLHLDLTWDDPVVSTGDNLLEHNFFLIDTPTLLTLEQTEHIYNQSIYSELKEA